MSDSNIIGSELKLAGQFGFPFLVIVQAGEKEEILDMQLLDVPKG